MRIVNIAKKCENVNWTTEQDDLLDKTFASLDVLLLSCQKEGSIEKCNLLVKAHEIIHDIYLVNSLKKMYKEL